ncbi:MAG: transglutaminase family protein [Propionicimonas sp.]
MQQRVLTSRLDLQVAGTSQLVLCVAVAEGVPLASEQLRITADGVPVLPTEVMDDHGTRLHVLEVGAGRVIVDYEAVVTGLAEPAPVTPADRIRYLRPSRYCESDSLGPTAFAEFAGLTSLNLLRAVVSWVNGHLRYVEGSSLPTDSAVRTLLTRQGVCRDFSHLSIALLRALNVPARLVAVYAPGLTPMEYHAVCEALIDDAWWVVDATQLAPRQSLVRVATGRDAADTAFLTSFGAGVELTGLDVTAVASDFTLDDSVALTQLR